MVSESRYVLSFGGGVNTVALLLLLVDRGSPLDEVVFADTGGEVPETYDYLPRIQDYLDKKGIPFTVLAKAPGRSLYETAWKRRVIPSAIWRWSTRDFKVNPIQRHYRNVGLPVAQYVGIAYDEVYRMKDSRIPCVTNYYPLIDAKMRRADCVRYIESSGWPVPVKSGCFFCPFNSLERWRWIATNHPDLMNKAIELEEHSKHFPSQRLTDQVFRARGKMTLRELAGKLRSGQQIELEQQAIACGGACMT